MKARFVSMNLGGLNDWFLSREKKLIQGLRRLEPDVVCLQEATVSHRDRFYHQPRAIGAGVGLRYNVFCPYGNAVEILSPEQGGIAILARWPILETRSRPLPSGHGRSTDARVALAASLEAPGGRLEVVTTHLSWEPEEAESRLLQMGVVLNEFESLAGARAVLVGDLNATDEEPAIDLLKEKLKDAFKSLHPDDNGYTWSPENPFAAGWNMPPRRLDYLFCERDVEISSAEVILTEPPVSDHYGLLVELRWKITGKR